MARLLGLQFLRRQPQRADDALIQGSRIRLVLAADAPESLRREVQEKGGEPVAPRLEDAYMSAVGGINQSPSPYGKLHVAREDAAFELALCA